MLTFIPPYMGEEVKSNAERKVFDILHDLNMKDAYILHSLGLPRHQDKIYGEIDFVVVCERGVACLEIKGGRVECREGRWFFTDRYGNEQEKTEGPIAQVTGNMFSLLSVLKEHFPNNPHISQILMACGVLFPDIHFHMDSEENIQGIIYDNQTEDITTYINGIFDYWQNRRHREPAKLSPSDQKELVHYLRGNFTFIETLGDRISDIDKRLIRLTKEQTQILDALSANDHLLIEGTAGTGKTVLATDFAMKNVARGLKVLYLTFNKNLAHDLRDRMQESENLKIINIHGLFGEYVTVNVDEMKQDPRKYFDEVLPNAFYDHLSSLAEDELEELRYDLLILDEGQDIIRPILTYAMDYLLKGGLEKGRWAMFYDPRQNIYNPEYEEGMDLISFYSVTKFKLFTNCRNTVQIGKYSEKSSGWEIGGFIREQGEEVRQVTYADEKDFKEAVTSIIKELRREGVDLRDVTFLSPRKYENSALAKTGISVAVIKDDWDLSSKDPRYATIYGFKGLDSKVVILIDMDGIRKELYSNLMYIATTRARVLLYILEMERDAPYIKRNEGKK